MVNISTVLESEQLQGEDKLSPYIYANRSPKETLLDAKKNSAVFLTPMKLEIKGIYSYSAELELLPDGTEDFLVPIEVDIGEEDNAGAERFHFVAASASGLQHQATGRDFHLLRGYILMEKFDIEIVRRAIQNLVDHARSKQNWHEVIELLSRYSRYDSEDM